MTGATELDEARQPGTPGIVRSTAGLGPALGLHTDHELKAWPGPFSAIVAGLKKAEFRRNDRGFRTGDWLLLREWEPDSRQYTGRWRHVQVTDMTAGFGIPDGFVMMSFRFHGAQRQRKRRGFTASA